jgi:2-isopropylmalate synthase
MLPDPISKYSPFPAIDLPDRQWPSRTITRVPTWCSVDLRDGNQALIEPMDSARKMRMFRKLVEIGFKEIEIGFPSASQTDFDFCRELIERDRIPSDVTVQVLVQARDPLIERTFEAVRGIRRAIVHLYNSTSTLQRRVVFNLDRPGVKEIATTGARTVLDCAAQFPETDWIFEYSPESFTGTELDYAVEVCEAVMDIWRARPEKRVIVNLPATVEMSTPNIYADQIEWFLQNTSKRDSMILSVHPHNDRGTAVAATELALLAGADRVEGTLFGNGERTGNVDIVTLAVNMYSQGLYPGLDFSRINDVIECAEFCTQLPVHPRHPYAGDLVFTAFSGSHQDAIKKGFAAQKPGEPWAIPYLPIDPMDLGRSYEPIIRVNSQSGKGGVSFLLERDYGIKMPRSLQIEFSRVIQQITDTTGREVTSAEIFRAFKAEYIDQQSPLAIRDHTEHSAGDSGELTATLTDGTTEYTLRGEGNGPIDAFVHALNQELDLAVRILDYDEHAIGSGADATAVSFVELRAGDTNAVMGVGMHRNILTASLNAITSALNRAIRDEVITLPKSRAQAGSVPA